MAWLAATIAVEAPRAVLGRLPERPMRVLSSAHWLPIAEVLDAAPEFEGSASRRNALRAESWAFVHDQHFHGASPAQVRGRLEQILAGGPSDSESFRRGLDADLAARDERLRRYGSRDRWEGVEIEQPAQSDLPAPRAIARADALTRLGWLALGLDRRTLAERHFRAVLHAQPDDAGAIAGLVTVAIRRTGWEDARSTLAHATTSDDPRLCIAAARLELEQARATQKVEARRRHANSARAHLSTCMALGAAPSQVDALIGAVYLVNGDASSARAPLERAQRALPSSMDVQLLRAEQQQLSGNPEAARALANAVEARSHDDSVREAARETLESL
jgi:Tfp pilus assembly protein PilF